MLIAIIITSALIVFSTLYVSSTSSCQSYNANTTIDAAIAAQGATLYCYCSYHFSEILTNSTVSSACGSLSNTILITNILQVVASLVSTVSNILLALLVSLIARKVLRPDTVPKEYSFIFSGIFLSNYINTTVLPLALNGNILGMESVTYLRFLNFINFAEVKIFKDFTSDWYALISPYYLNIILIVLISPLVSLGIASIWNCFTHYRVRKACESSDKDNQITQKEANARLTTGVFPFA